ncbi:hypothetical protein [Nocardioides sp.]|uniref:hypothetical protein n=1 Tax=Nocardioides sp. TaxID=35761 RepID=UPI0031FE7130|nr:hypothetical protein [Nocardioides sp.]
MTDPSEHSGSQWEPVADIPTAGDTPAPHRGPGRRSRKHRPGRLVLAAGAVGFLALGGAGGFFAGQAAASSNGGGASVVDPTGNGLSGTPPGSVDRGGSPGTPPGLGGGYPAYPNQDQGGTAPDAGTGLVT